MIWIGVVLVGILVIYKHQRPRIAKISDGTILWYGNKQRKYIWLNKNK